MTQDGKIYSQTVKGGRVIRSTSTGKIAEVRSGEKVARSSKVSGRFISASADRWQDELKRLANR